MIDLAYSAVLFNEKDLADEVIELYERVQYLKAILQMNTALAVRTAKEAEGMVGIMRMGNIIERLSDAAKNIANIVFLGLAVDPYITDAFLKVRERIIKTTITHQSILIGKKLLQLRLEATIGINVIAIRRSNEVIANPKSDTILRDGDVVIARGSDVGIFEFDKLATGELRIIPAPEIDVKEAHA